MHYVRFKFVFSGIFARALVLALTAFTFRVEKVFILFVFSWLAIGIAVALSFVIHAFEKWLYIHIQKRFSPKIMNKINSKVSGECSNNLQNQIYFVVCWIIRLSFCSILYERNLLFRKAIPFDWLLITFRHVYFVVVKVSSSLSFAPWIMINNFAHLFRSDIEYRWKTSICVSRENELKHMQPFSFFFEEYFFQIRPVR